MTNANPLSEYASLFPTNPTVSNSRPSSPNQHKFYLDLCEQKRRTPVDGYDAMSFNQLSILIDELKEIRPVSDAQIAAINSCLERLNAVGISIDINIDELTGGREGTASAYIEKLFELTNKHCPPEAKPASDKQLEYVSSMYLCPSVNFEDYGVERWIYLDNGMKRRPTGAEFIADLKTKFDSITISDFINKNRGEFNEWRKTRIRPGQLKHIMTLLERNGGSQVDQLTLLQFSQEEADAYIHTLTDELKVKLPTSLEQPDTRELTINITQKQAEESEDDKLRNIIFGLLAESGDEIDDVELLLSDDEELKDFFVYMFSCEHITPEKLAEIIDDSDRLKAIFQPK